MFIFSMGTAVLFVYVAAAVLPAALLLAYIYKKDTIEKEPTRLLGRLVLGGVGAALASIVIEGIGQRILNSTVSANSPLYVIILAFLVVAVAEEGTKFFFLKRLSWNNPDFDYLFDGVVYAVFVSLGFAAFENLGYVFGYGLTVAPSRALLAIPGHMSFAVYMGYFYGRAKDFDYRGLDQHRRFYLWTAYITAVFLHGFYDTCAMKGTTASTIIFLVFVVIMFISVFRLVKKESQMDHPIN